MFALADRKTRLYRYEISYKDEEGKDIIDKVISEQEKDIVEQRLAEHEISFTTIEINQAENEWFEGMYFKSYDEALEVFNKGEQTYLQEKQRQELTDNLRLRADIDYLSIMSGVEI